MGIKSLGTLVHMGIKSQKSYHQKLQKHPNAKVFLNLNPIILNTLTDCLGGKEAWRPTHFS